ncbi:unnamed protein product [Brassica rapa subsp. narinosa]
MIGRADIEGSKSNVAMNAWLPQASYPCGNFSDTSSFKFRRSKGSIGHAFKVRIRTENQNQTSFYPFVPHEISVLVELILGHLLHTDVRVCPSAHTGRPWPSVSTHRTSGCPSVHISARSVDCSGDFGPRGLSVQYTQDVRQHTQDVHGCPCVSLCPSVHTGCPSHTQDVRQHTQDVRGCPCVSVCPSVHTGRPSAHTGRPSAHAGRPSAHAGRPWLSVFVCKGFYPPLGGNYNSRRSERRFHRTDLANDTCLWEPKLLLRVGNRAAGACVASSPDSDLEAFSHNPAHDVPPQPNSPPDNVLRPDRPAEASLGSKRRGCYPASDSRSNRIPLVRTSSELAVRRPGKAPERAVPSPSPGRHEAVRSHHVSSSSSPPTVDAFGTGTPEPSPQSQSFSRCYGSILPTSLAYIVPSTRGCSPWRPDAVMSTTGRERHSVLRIFKGRRECTGHHATCGALPAAGPYLRLSRFQGGQAVKQKR